MEDDQQFKLHLHEDQLLVCPSFSSYSTSKLSDIADKVAKEVNPDAESIDEDSDLDFSFVRCCDENLTSAVEEGIHVFPIFNQESDRSSNISTINVSLKKLFLDEDEERDPPFSSSSSSEIDELELIPPETYCVWKPKEAEAAASPSTCKKSRSTGSGSKRWKLRDLLYRRSNSDGKSAFIFLREKPKSAKVEISDQRRNLADGGLKQVKEKRVSSPANYMQLFYSRNRAIKESEKRKTYLPYRRDLVGFYTTVNGIGRGFPSF